MSNSVVPAAAVAHAKQLVRNKKVTKRAEDQKPSHDDQPVADKDSDTAHAVQVERGDRAHASMSDTSMSSDFTFVGALSAAAGESASLMESSAQDDGGSVGDDGDGAGGTILLVGAVGLAGLGVAVAAGGGGGNDNEAPTITSAATATIAENAPVATAVYTTTATDPDGDPLTFTLSGTDAAAFNISAAGVVTLKAPADFETKSSYSFNVVASDGELTATKAVAVTVTNVAEGPTFTSAGTATVTENVPTSTVVYDAEATGSGTVTFGLAGADKDLFNINTTTGVVTLKASPDFETKPSYAITVTATDANGTSSKAVAVTVNNVDPEPTTATIAVGAAGSNTDSDLVATTYNVTLGNYEYTITGLDAGADKIVGPGGVAPSVLNSNTADGEVTLQYASNNQIALITIEGLTAQQDSQIFGVNSFNTVFGAGTIA